MVADMECEGNCRLKGVAGVSGELPKTFSIANIPGVALRGISLASGDVSNMIPNISGRNGNGGHEI